MKFDEIDLELLELLQADSNINIKELASKLEMTKSPLYERIRRLEKQGTIEKYVAILNEHVLEKAMIVFCSVSLESQKLEEIKIFNEEVSKIPEVLECYLMGGSNDYLLKVVVKNLHEYHMFSSGKLAALKNVGQIKSTFVLNTVKKSTVYPIF